ncbi:phosphonate ABC transporter substrate-binding protein [Brucella endophytica]|uniref:Phosphonate ABC transporter substrate-binding protein n=2 Tax=Brucella endophytica TaxID=1963359 RepID=A0A916WDV9_9HYPH|nr:phosphonate ABC transporter substrate-binding protein [Brucella endophytica]
MLSANAFSRLLVLGSIAILGLTNAAHADWRKEMGQFRIGVASPRVAELPPADVEKLKSAYSKALDMPVDLVVLPDIPALVDAQATERVDYAVDTAAAYAAAYASCECVEPLVAPVGTDGSLGIRSILLLRPGIGDEDMKGVRIALPAEAAKAASLGPVSAYMVSGQNTDAVRETFINAGSLENAEKLFVAGKADGFFGWVPSSGDDKAPSGGTLARLKKQGLKAGSYRIAWESSLLRYGPHAVRSNLAPEAKLILRRFLVSLSTQDPEVYDLLDRVHGGGFVAVGPHDYRMPQKMLSAITGQKAEL